MRFPVRPFAFILLSAALAMPAAAQKLGERTIPPEQILAEMGSGNSDEELAKAVAAASVHPLGTMENPVRVGGPEGSRAYIARLRCSDGSAPAIGQRTSAGVGAFGSIVDAWALDCGKVAPGQTRLVMDMYHAEHDEMRAPAGFTLAAR